jgi:tetratricopeptide (TPR) repeat protein
VKRPFYLLTLFFLGTVGSVWAAVDSEAVYHMVMARLLADEGRGREATESFVAAIELSPEDPYIRLEYSRFLIRQRRLRKAAQQVSTAYQLAPDEPDVLRVYAETQLKMAGEDSAALSEARQALEKLREIDPTDVESMVSLGQIYLSEQSPERAADVFQAVLDQTSGNRMVYRLLVDALVRSGQSERAVSVLEEALELDPLFTRARIVLSEILGELGRVEESVEVLSAAPEVALGDPELQRRLALELHRTGDFEGALVAIDRVLLEEPSDYAAMYLKTVILSVQGDNERAIQLAKRLVALHPDSLDVVILLAQLLERQGEWQEADLELQRVERQARVAREMQSADQALGQRAIILSRAQAWRQVVEALEPHLPELEDAGQIDLIFLYADAQVNLQEEGKALAILSRFESGSPAERSALAKQAEILFRSADESQANEKIAELLATDTYEDMVRAAEVFQRLERFDEAIPILERALSLVPDSTQAMFWLGASYERAGRVSEAETVLEGLLDIDPTFAPALNYLGYMWADQGENLDEALDLVRQAVALEPENGAYIDSLGWAHFQLGQYDEARGYLERAARIVGDDAVVLEHLGDLYIALGEFDDARDFYQRSLSLDAENAGQVQQKLEQLGGGR